MQSVCPTPSQGVQPCARTPCLYAARQLTPPKPIAKNVLTILVNLSSHDEEIRTNLAEDDDLLIDLVRKITVILSLLNYAIH